MANLVSTTCTSLTSNVISAPLAFITSDGSQKEFSGMVSLSNGGSADIITNEGGYILMNGTVHFYGMMDGMAWTFGIFDFQLSRYGIGQSNILVSDWGSFALSHYQNPSNVNINSLRFTNNNGFGGDFYFAVVTNQFTTVSSSALTRIK